jgi:uncharacterized Tic20 family protein
MDSQSIETFFKDETKTTLVFILSPLLGLAWQPLAFIAPLLLWLNFKDKFSLVSYYAKELTNLSINLFIVSLIPIGLMLLSPFAGLLIASPVIFSLIAQILYAVNAHKAKTYHMPYTYKFIKGL